MLFFFFFFFPRLKLFDLTHEIRALAIFWGGCLPVRTNGALLAGRDFLLFVSVIDGRGHRPEIGWS